MDRLSGRLAALAIIAGLGWRLAAAWPAGDAARPYAVPQEEYFLSSVMLLSSGVYTADPAGAPQQGRGPLFTTFLALTQAGAGRPSPRAARVALALLGALAALAAYGLGARLRSPAAGAFAAAFVSLDPALIAGTRSLDVHAFYGAVMLLLACAAARWAERGGDRASGNLLGAALGASLLCRSAHLALLPLLAGAAIVWWGRDGRRRAARVLLVAAAVLVPWTLRNYAHTGRFVPLDAGVGAYNLLAAADGGDRAVQYGEAFAIADRLEPGFSALHRDEAVERRDAAVLRLALRLIRAAPLDYARGCARRLAVFWLPLWFFLLPAAFAALSPKASRGTRAAALVAAAFSAYAAIGLGEGYRLGVEPLLAALAGIGAAGLLPRSKAKARTDDRPLLPLAAAIGVPAILCLLLAPLDALAARRSRRPDCLPPSPRLAAFLDDGVRLAGEDWYLAPWAGTLRARPDVCAGMSAFAADDSREAVRRFETAVALAPRDPGIRVSLAVALGAAGQKTRALRECAAADSLASAGEATGELRRLKESIRSTCAGLEAR
jgi:4-amino-4-deoxy-L-arabinose transferase-like glycosyltransferase